MFPTATYKKMDMQSRLQRKKQDSALKIRQINKMAKRMLNSKLEYMETSFQKESRIRYKERKKLQYEFSNSDLTNEELLLPKLSISDLSVETEDYTNTPRSARGCPFKNGSICFSCSSCRFQPMSRRHRCRYFPCAVPASYHSMGFNVRPPSRVVLDDYGFDIFHTSNGVPMSESCFLEADDDGSDKKSPRCSIRDRMRGLKQLVKEMKDRNEQSRPRDWAVNYGNPVSRRQLLNPVIPV